MYLLTGERVAFKTIDEQDSDLVFRWRNDKDLNNSILAPSFPYTSEKAKNWINNCNRDENQLVFGIVFIENEAKLIGVIRLMFINWINRNAEIGIFIGEKDYQNRGIGKETIQLILNYGFNDLNLERIYLKVGVTNYQAIKLYINCGFFKEGTLRKHHWSNGKYIDVIQLGILKSEFIKFLKNE